MPPVGFVVALALALVLSNQSAPLPSGAAAILTNAEFEEVERKVEALTLTPIQAYDGGQKLSSEEISDLRAADGMVDRMTAFEPLDSNWFFLSGKIHHMLGEDRIAEERFRQCVFLYADDAVARPLDRTHLIQTGAEAAYQLSLLSFARGDVEGALDAADTAVRVIPNSPNYLVARAAALNELRRTDEAKKDLAQALKLDPKNAKAATLFRFISH